MVREGVLPPAESGAYISERAEHVKIHSDGINRLCNEVNINVDYNLYNLRLLNYKLLNYIYTG